MDPIIVSVIVPLYNAEGTISRCLDSLRGQTLYPKMEIIVVDDGSSDGSRSVIGRYAADPRVSLYCVPNGGVSRARNIGLEKARGQYVGFVDADDWVAPDFYEKLLAQALSGDCDVVSMGFRVVQPDGGNSFPCPTTPATCVMDREEAVRRFLTGKMDVHACTKLFRRRTYREQRFAEDRTVSEDRLFVFRQLLLAGKVSLLPECGYHYVQKPSEGARRPFSDRYLGILDTSEEILDLTKRQLPQLFPCAACSDILAKCRLLSMLEAAGRPARYAALYRDLKQEIRAFPLGAALGCASRKHLITLALTKLSPPLVAALKRDPHLKFRK